MEVLQQGRDTIVRGIGRFSLEQTLDCGQCFRWEQGPDGRWSGIVSSAAVQVSQEGGSLRFHDTPPETFEKLWRDYFDLDRDYGALCELFSQDEALSRAVAFCGGIRVLRQPPWEALCSFILSQNNNIKRIKGLVSRLCETFGEPIPGGFSFPSPERLAGCTAEDLAPVRAGFRARYVIDAAQKVASGTVNLSRAAAAPVDEARAELMQIVGVGVKVADCALLYGLHRIECLPVDVWIRRVLEQLYPGGLPCGFLPWAGIAQQYLFHYARLCEGALEPVG